MRAPRRLSLFPAACLEAAGYGRALRRPCPRVAARSPRSHHHGQVNGCDAKSEGIEPDAKSSAPISPSLPAPTEVEAIKPGLKHIRAGKCMSATSCPYQECKAQMNFPANGCIAASLPSHPASTSDDSAASNVARYQHITQYIVRPPP